MDHNNLTNIIQKGWGTEEIIINQAYCGKIMRVKPYGRSSMHFHAIKHETFYIISGEMTLRTIDTKTSRKSIKLLKKGDSYSIEPLVPHSFKNEGDSELAFIEFSTHDNLSDSFRVEPGDSQNGIL